MHRFFGTTQQAKKEVLFSLNDLQNVTSTVPDLDVVEYCYYLQVKGFRPLSEDIAHYNREEEGSKVHSYEYLYDSVNRHLQRARQHKLREVLSEGLTGNPTSPSVPGPLEGKEGKGQSPAAL